MTKLKFLGTGTSQGIPMIGCTCQVCRSSDPRDKRLRSSAMVEFCGMSILVDAGPDFRQQMLRENISHIDAILLTHNHKDHTGGLDDIRAFNYLEREASEIYCESYVKESLKMEYPYAFAEVKYPGAPEWNVHLIGNEAFDIVTYKNKEKIEWKSNVGYEHISSGKPLVDKTARIVPVRGMHGKLPVLGFRFGNIAYCTDMNSIPESEFEKLHGLEHFVINTVKFGTHNSHFGFDEAVAICKRVGANNSWLTHLSHRLPNHEELGRILPPGIRPAYDGLVIED